MAQRSIFTPLRTALPRPLLSSPIRAASPFLTTTPQTQIQAHRLASTKNSFLEERPSPPRLPPSQQAEFERLQREAEAKLHSHTQTPTTPAPSAAPQTQATTVTTPEAGTFSGGIRKGAPPEFEGDKNPKTGEVGGPKNEPLRWGAGGDWSFNGRVTDF